MRLGIFGGAFNPVHNGHVNLAKSYLSSLALDKLLIIPTANPPHRSAIGFASEEDRLNMLSLAFEGVEKIELSDIEFKRSEKSYTYDTVKELRKTYTNDEIFLIIGEDQFLMFNSWYKYKELLDEVVLCTAAREKDTQKALADYAQKLFGSNYGYYIADFEPIVVSSSALREKLKAGEDVSAYLPDKVYNYIKDKGLYLE